MMSMTVFSSEQIRRQVAAQHALAPDAAPLRFAAQVKRRPLAGPVQILGVHMKEVNYASSS